MKTRKIRKTKTADWRFLAGFVLVILVVSGVIFYFAARTQLPPLRQSENNDPTPPYSLSPASARPLPKTDKPSSFTNKFVVAAYSAANEIPEVLAQQPCYCKRRGHRTFAGLLCDQTCR